MSSRAKTWGVGPGPHIPGGGKLLANQSPISQISGRKWRVPPSPERACEDLASPSPQRPELKRHVDKLALRTVFYLCVVLKKTAHTLHTQLTEEMQTEGLTLLGDV